MLETACELHVDRTLLVGTKTTLRVTDRSGEPQARAHYAGETLLGKTGPDGTLKYTFTTAGLQTLHAVSSAGRSQNASAVVCDKPYVNEGLPFGVQNNAVAGASTAQSITWLSSIDSSAEKALVRYAEKSRHDGRDGIYRNVQNSVLRGKHIRQCASLQYRTAERLEFRNDLLLSGRRRHDVV